MNWLLARTPVWLLLLSLMNAQAASSSRVDDSGTVVSQSVVPMRWRQLVPGRGADHTVEGQVRVALRLNLAPWRNQRVRVYMALAPLSNVGPVQATWRTQGRLLAGTVRSGGRTPVFEGVVNTSAMEETLDLTIATDGRPLVSMQSLQFTFELDTL